VLQVNFYLLSTNSVESRLLTACRLVDKALQAGQRVFIQLENDTDAQACDEWLWSFKAESFIPHHRLGDGQFIDAPVLLGLKTPVEADGVLLNLSTRAPQGLAQFQRVLEVIANDEQLKQAGRSRWQYYRQQGFRLEKYDL